MHKPLGMTVSDGRFSLESSHSLAKISFIIADAPYKDPSDYIYEINRHIETHLANPQYMGYLNNRIMKIIDKLIIDGLLHTDYDTCLINCLDLIDTIVSAESYGLVVAISARIQIIESLIRVLIAKLTENVLADQLQRKIMDTIELNIVKCGWTAEIFGSLHHLMLQYSLHDGVVLIFAHLLKASFTGLLNDEKGLSTQNNEETLNQMLVLSHLCFKEIFSSECLDSTEIESIEEKIEGFKQIINGKLPDFVSNVPIFDETCLSLNNLPYKTIQPLKLSSKMNFQTDTILKSPVKVNDDSITKSNYRYYLNSYRNITPPSWMNLFESTRMSCYNIISMRSSTNVELITSNDETVGFNGSDEFNDYQSETPDGYETRYDTDDMALETPSYHPPTLLSTSPIDTAAETSNPNTNQKSPKKKKKKKSPKIREKGKIEILSAVSSSPTSTNDVRKSKSFFSPLLAKSSSCWKCFWWPWHVYNHEISSANRVVGN